MHTPKVAPPTGGQLFELKPKHVGTPFTGIAEDDGPSGEEFNSITEQSARLAQALADGLGVGLGKLREMAQAGQLTADVVLRAFQSQREKVSAEFEQLPPTVARAVQNVQTEWMRLVGTFNQSSGVTGAVAEGIDTLVRNLDGLAAMAGRAKECHAQLEPIERLGQLLHDNSESARKRGIGIPVFIEFLIASAPESFGSVRTATGAAAGSAAPRMRLRLRRAAHRPIAATKLGRRHD